MVCVCVGVCVCVCGCVCMCVGGGGGLLRFVGRGYKRGDAKNIGVIDSCGKRGGDIKLAGRSHIAKIQNPRISRRCYDNAPKF